MTFQAIHVRLGSSSDTQRGQAFFDVFCDRSGGLIPSGELRRIDDADRPSDLLSFRRGQSLHGSCLVGRSTRPADPLAVCEIVEPPTATAFSSVDASHLNL